LFANFRFFSRKTRKCFITVHILGFFFTQKSSHAILFSLCVIHLWGLKIFVGHPPHRIAADPLQSPHLTRCLCPCGRQFALFVPRFVPDWTPRMTVKTLLTAVMAKLEHPQGGPCAGLWQSQSPGDGLPIVRLRARQVRPKPYSNRPQITFFLTHDD